MHCALTVVRYPKGFAYFGFLSMAVFRFFLWKNRNISFYKLMGSGKNGTFDVRPDFHQWALLAVFNSGISHPKTPADLYGNRIANWWKRYRCEVLTIALQPIEGHGTWDGKECFGKLPETSDENGVIAVLTRAAIRLSKAKAFWKNVPAAAAAVRVAPGFITSFGIGEIPWLKQATFSVWQSKQLMKEYAYKQAQHRQVIQKTRKENWYREEMFVRFHVLWTTGLLNGNNDINKFL